MAHRIEDVKITEFGWDLTRGQVMEIHCQECGAKPGERCVTSGGKTKADPHFLRKADRHDGIDPGPDANVSKIQGLDGREWSFDQFATWLISLTIRNELEMFHGGGAMDPENPNPEDPEESEGFITDRQMKALNIVIRHTVYDVLSAISHPDRVIDEEHGLTNAHAHGWTLNYINDYMEPPGSDELEAAYQKIKNGEFDPPGFVPDCTRSEP